MPPQTLSTSCPSSLFQSLPQQHALRVGVLGCAKVLFKSWPALHSAGHKVIIIGCRDAVRATGTAKEMIDKIETAKGNNSSPRQSHISMPAIGTYEDVVRSPEVDVVYITLPVALRDPWVRACIAAGKHVVGEKPAAASAAQLLSWLEGFSLRRLLYMDGTILTHASRMELVREKVRSLGILKHIEVNFAFLASDIFFRQDIRNRTDLEPHGALGDLGWYAIRWILHMVDFALPAQVSGAITSVTPPRPDGNAGGAISAFEGHMTFGGSHGGPCSSPASPNDTATVPPVTASFSCSFLSAYQQSVKIFSSGGVIEVQGAINATGEDRPHFITRTTVPGAPGKRPAMKAEKVYCEATMADGSQQAVDLWRAVGSSLLRLGVGEPLLLNPVKGKDWGRNAYVTQLVLDKLLESATTLRESSECTAAERLESPILQQNR